MTLLTTSGALFGVLLATSQPAGPLAAFEAAMPAGRQRAADHGALASTYWRLTHVGGTAVALEGLPRDPHLVFQPDGTLTGADGCNTIRSGYTASGDTLTIRAPLMGTLMTCTLPDRLDQRFREALGKATRWATSATTLTLLDDAGGALARFEAVPR